jgi:hypothetical protein
MSSIILFVAILINTFYNLNYFFLQVLLIFFIKLLKIKKLKIILKILNI